MTNNQDKPNIPKNALLGIRLPIDLDTLDCVVTGVIKGFDQKILLTHEAHGFLWITEEES